jgi:hypothetical protein
MPSPTLLHAPCDVAQHRLPFPTGLLNVHQQSAPPSDPVSPSHALCPVASCWF